MLNLIAKNDKGTKGWLSLNTHLHDTAELMKYLIREFVAPSFAGVCGLSQEMLESVGIFLAFVHDIGKATIIFQYTISHNVPELILVLEKSGLKFPEEVMRDSIQKTPHGLAGEVILRFLGCPKEIAAIVGTHHGVPSDITDVNKQNLKKTPKDIERKENYFGDFRDRKFCKSNRELLEKEWKRILEEGLRQSSLSGVEELPQNLSLRAQVLLTGLVIVADWLASDMKNFPLTSWKETYAENVSSSIRAQKAWERTAFTAMWESRRNQFSDAAFETFFGFAPNHVQQAVVRALESSKEPGILILEAPMGCGKTEAALAAAEIMAAKRHKNGLFFGLPTQATANGIFPRIKRWCEQQSVNEYHSIQLRHGNAEFNEAFQEIQRGFPGDETDSGVIVHQWFCNPKKACLAEFVVATVDHLLMMALKKRHLMLLHLGLSQKVVIVDECHAYDAYMNQYLERALQWLGEYRAPVILLSATLPVERRKALIRAYLNLEESDLAEMESCAYPLLTWSDGGQIHQQEVPYYGARRKVRIEKGTREDALAKIRTAAASGGCVGVIVNTVKLAQKIAGILRESTDAEVLLFHARFTYSDRAALEKRVLERTGKDSTPQQRKNLIVVGTQVLEQSLDIDFDFLVTEICPMDLLLQRIGRLQRHVSRDPSRPEALRSPRCIVITGDKDEDSSGTRKIYGDWLLEKTLEFMPDAMTLPDDISRLVQEVYSAQGDDSEAFSNFQRKKQKQVNQAGIFLLEKGKEKGTLHGLLSMRVTEDKYEAEAHAAVRDGLDSIEVLLMQRYKDGTIHFLPHFNGGAEVSGALTEDESRCIAEQRLRLPGTFCNDEIINELEESCKNSIASWQNFHWLRGPHVLFFDETMCSRLGDYILRYSPYSGLEYEGVKNGEKNSF